MQVDVRDIQTTTAAATAAQQPVDISTLRSQLLATLPLLSSDIVGQLHARLNNGRSSGAPLYQKRTDVTRVIRLAVSADQLQAIEAVLGAIAGDVLEEIRHRSIPRSMQSAKRRRAETKEEK